MENITTQLAEKFSNMGVKSSYGDPVELDGTTIIPVALTSFGFGGGEGIASDDEEKREPAGGGGGGSSVPIGAYVTRNGTTHFEPNTITLLVVGIPLVFVTGRALSRIIKALKR